MSRATVADLEARVEALEGRLRDLEAAEAKRSAGRFVEKAMEGEARPVGPAPVLDFRTKRGRMGGR